MTPRPSLVRWSRAAIAAAVGVMAIALLALVWSTDRGVRSASRTVVRGEAVALAAQLRARLGEAPDPPLATRLATAFDAMRADGVAYVAILAPDRVDAEVGAPPMQRDALLAWAKQATFNVPSGDDREALALSRRSRSIGGSGGATPPRGEGVVIAFSPKVAGELRENATRTLVIGALAALTLIGIAIALVVWSLRREKAVRAFEQARHLAHLGQMSAVLAHEIRNPLASLKGNAQLLAHTLPDGDKPRAKADRVVEEATRLETLTNDLLEFARSGNLHRTGVDPAALAREVALEVNGERVRVDADAAPRTWRLDAARMRQVLVNLVENAVELSDQDVDVRVAKRGGALAITVADRGPGIPPADLDHVFEPFFTKRTRGTGLGLAVARRLVELHGGTIAARPRDGGGTTFEVVIPR